MGLAFYLEILFAALAFIYFPTEYVGFFWLICAILANLQGKDERKR